MRSFGDLGINGIAARWYGGNSRKHRIREMRGFAEEVTRHVRDGSSILEIAPGPGYLFIELAKMGYYNLFGMDISRDFVDIARRNAEEAGVKIDFRQGNVSDIPFPDNSFDFIICTAAFKNFKEPLKALDEMCRVLKQDRTALIVDMKGNVSSHDLDNLMKQMGVKRMEALFVKLTFKYFLRKGAYSKSEMAGIITKTAFRDFRIEEAEVTLSTCLHKKSMKEMRESLDIAIQI